MLSLLALGGLVLLAAQGPSSSPRPAEPDSVGVARASSGGNACPSTYRIVAFSEERRPRASAEFGNCSGIPVVLLDGTRLRVRFPGFYLNHQARRPGFRPPPAVTWEYTGDGQVRRLPASAPAR